MVGWCRWLVGALIGWWCGLLVSFLWFSLVDAALFIDPAGFDVDDDGDDHDHVCDDLVVASNKINYTMLLCYTMYFLVMALVIVG